MEEARLEALLPVIGEDELAEGHQRMGVAVEPEHVALVEGEDSDAGMRRRNAGDPFEHRDEALVLEDLAVAIDVVAELAQVEDQLDVVGLMPASVSSASRKVVRRNLAMRPRKSWKVMRFGIGVLGDRQADDRQEERSAAA